MKRSWRNLLQTTLSRLTADAEGPPRTAVVGVGHELRGDDAAGCAVAHTLAPLAEAHSHVLVLDAGAAPENQLGPLRRFGPDLVIFVDAAQMGERAGTVRWFSPDETTGVSASTHTLPPAVIAQFLELELGCEVALIGIQPEQNALGTPMSAAVQPAIAEVVHMLAAELLVESVSNKSN